MLGRAAICSVVLVVCVAAALGYRALEEFRTAAAGPPIRLSGDVNGDRRVDVADAIYLLEHLFNGGQPPVDCGAPADATTLIFLVRHAERDGPELSEPGLVRAERLATSFAHMKVDALIASDLVRTQQTLEPLARSQAEAGNPLSIQVTEATAAAAVAAIRALPAGSKAVVAHHSFTVMGILSELGATPERLPFPGDEYDNVWVVTLDPGDGAAMALFKYHVVP